MNSRNQDILFKLLNLYKIFLKIFRLIAKLGNSCLRYFANVYNILVN